MPDSMPALDGLEATRRILAARAGGPRIVVLTTFDLDESVFEAMRAGASGVLLKSVRPHQLVEAVRTVIVGDALPAPHDHPAPARRVPPPPATRSGARPGLDELTKRELEVLELIAPSASRNVEIAAQP